MKKIFKISFYLTLIPLTLSVVYTHFGCNPFSNDTSASDRDLCQAVDASSTQEFLDAGNVGIFEELNNDQDTFLFISDMVTSAYDGQNVIELKSAIVDFDFEDASVDAGDAGGFYARWRIVLVPFTDDRFTQFQNASSQNLLSQFRSAPDRIEVLLSGPFLQNDCEWGDTDEIGSQTLTYTNYALYDWDFFPETNRVLGVLFESDEGVGDDVITKIDISQNAGTVILDESDLFHIEIESLSNVAPTL